MVQVSPVNAISTAMFWPWAGAIKGMARISAYQNQPSPSRLTSWKEPFTGRKRVVRLMDWHRAYSRWSASSKSLDALLVDAMVSGLCRLVEYQLFELFYLAVPAQLQCVQPGLGPYSLQQAGLVCQSQGVVDKAFVFGERRFQAVLLVPDVFRRSGIVKRHYRQAAGHGFQHHVAEGVGFTGEQEQVAGGIVPGQVVALPGTTENVVRVSLFQLAPQWPIAH